MTRLFIVFFMVILFSSCSSKTQNPIVLNTLPHYNKDKVNLYFVNNETSLGLQVHFKYKITSNEQTKEILTCYGQYSYQELEEGDYTLEAVSSEFQPLGKREDHIPYKNYLKNGETYIVKAFTTTDVKAIGKQLFSMLAFSPDALIELKEIGIDKGLKEMSLAKEFKGGAVGRYPFRAEDNPKNQTCLGILFDKI